MATITISISKMNVKIESGKIYNHSVICKTWAVPIDNNLNLDNIFYEMEVYIQKTSENDWRQPFKPLCKVWVYHESDFCISTFGLRDSVTENFILEVFEKMCNEKIAEESDHGLDFDDYLFREVFRDWI